MQTKQTVERLISKTAEGLCYPPKKHLCLTCIRYIRGFCNVGEDITHGNLCHDMLSGCITRQWGSKDNLPVVSISVIQCARYKKV
ncbi:MAG TPA: hypothetical protein PLL96_10400 [Syntrophorhabdaceae bacterium]|nr:hypothetical protein [Syntrophorhabdaceae bacterium]HRR72731.1 hypothetical protein [Syntrophorhabdaceae bacterium]HRV23500.1 hypothetical protein [Syntrophorhabdaceae bacterium]